MKRSGAAQAENHISDPACLIGQANFSLACSQHNGALTVHLGLCLSFHLTAVTCLSLCSVPALYIPFRPSPSLACCLLWLLIMAYTTFGLYALAGLACCFLIAKLAIYIENVRFAKAHGCEAVPQYPQPERILGWKLFREQVAHEKNKTLLEAGRARYNQVGDTFSFTVMGQPFISTRDPENIKAILATNFKDFGIGRRIDAFGALFGNGIFTADGAHWEHSRVTSIIPRNGLIRD